MTHGHLEHVWLKWESRNYVTLLRGAAPEISEYKQMSSGHLLLFLYSFKIVFHIFSEALSEDGQICVYFFKNHLKTYDVPMSWEQARMQTQKDLQLHQGW